MVAFASGGRRRSEVARLRQEQFTAETPITDEDGPPLSCHSSRPYENVVRRSGRGRLSHRPACRGTEDLA